MAVETLSKLCEFVDRLVEFKARLMEPETLNSKANLLQDLLSTFYSAEAQSSWDLIQVNQVIESLESHYENKDYQGDVSAKVLSYLVEQGLKEKGVGQRFLIGSVNFCTLMPMRAVPFKVVCLLGMNDQDYPRQVQPIGFDLVSKSNRRKGDRSRKFDDRYLFLEALLSARDALYLSFIGRSCFNNEPLVPSVLVEELFEYIERAFVLEGAEQNAIRARLHLKAPLQPFNERHYQSGQLHSYNPTWMLSSDSADASAEPARRDEFDFKLPATLDISHFIRSILNPQALFYQQSLGVKIKPIEDIEQDDEPFALDALSRYQYLSELLDARLYDKNVVLEQWLQRGELPHAAAGELMFETLESRVDSLVTSLKPMLESKKEPREVRLEIAGTQLEGWLNRLYGNQQIFYRSASIKAKDRITAFIWHCIGTLLGESETTLILGLDEQVLLQAITQQDASNALMQWLEFYQHSLNRPMPFFANSSMTYIMTEDLNKARQKFEGHQFVGPGDNQDPYVALCFSSLADIESEFIELAETLLTPIKAISVESTHAGA
jgi:exodeoxyribonuclease V gamma subunit